MLTRKKYLEEAMLPHDESWKDVESCTFNEKKLSIELTEKEHKDFEPYTLWTKKRVYFLCTYDSYETWCDSVPRNPDGSKTSIGS